MSTNVGGVGLTQGAPVATGPAATIRELVQLLREQRQAELDNEQAMTDIAVEVAEDRAEHARERAEALRGQAWLRFGMAMAGAVSSAVTTSIGAAALGAEGRERQVEQGVRAAMGRGEHEAARRLSGEAAEHADRAASLRRSGALAQATAASLKKASSAGLALDEATGSGFGGRARQLDGQIERDRVRGEVVALRADQVETRRLEIEDALADARQCYRDIVNGKEGA